MNRELLARVRDRIAEVGNEHCTMEVTANGTIAGMGEIDCGTVACIAGHTIAVANGSFVLGDHLLPEDEARELLGLQTRHLFYEPCWPTHYQNVRHREGDAKAMLSLCDAILDGLVEATPTGLVDLGASDEEEDRCDNQDQD